MHNILDDDVTKQWRIKRGADWATARGPQHLGGPQFQVGKKSNMWTIHNTL